MMNTLMDSMPSAWVGFGLGGMAFLGAVQASRLVWKLGRRELDLVRPPVGKPLSPSGAAGSERGLGSLLALSVSASLVGCTGTLLGLGDGEDSVPAAIAATGAGFLVAVPLALGYYLIGAWMDSQARRTAPGIAATPPPVQLRNRSGLKPARNKTETAAAYL